MNWEAFFDDYRIEWVSRGPNVKRGNINIACPYCGDDHSHHMGVSLEGKGYGCWRSANHAGKKPHNLIRELLKCSFNQAQMIAKQYSVADPEDLDEALAALQGMDAPDKTPTVSKPLDFRPDFKRIKPKGLVSRFYNYLEKRGFGKDTQEVCDLYDLRCAMTGQFKDRIIIPIYQKEKLVSWTSRSIGKNTNAPRYLALSEEHGGLVNVFNTIWNWDELKAGGDLLIIVEGPFDAIKVDYYGIKYDTCATCTFGTSMSEEQAYLLTEVSKNFTKSVLLYDPEATEAIFRARDLLYGTNVECGFLEAGIEDPGAMSKQQVHRFIKNYLK